MSTNPQQLNPKTPPQPKAPERDIIREVRRELDRTGRQLEGLGKALKRLNERIKEAT